MQSLIIGGNRGLYPPMRPLILSDSCRPALDLKQIRANNDVTATITGLVKIPVALKPDVTKEENDFSFPPFPLDAG
ncbi:MAG: hypothetical protein HQL58_09625 [Magnetococcales bacterium]|nr:hypothetical protein [Magnetococcales bacterium]